MVYIILTAVIAVISCISVSAMENRGIISRNRIDIPDVCVIATVITIVISVIACIGINSAEREDGWVLQEEPRKIYEDKSYRYNINWDRVVFDGKTGERILLPDGTVMKDTEKPQYLYTETYTPSVADRILWFQVPAERYYLTKDNSGISGKNKTEE